MIASTYSGYSRKPRLIQKPRIDPFRSSDAGMMYPLTRKNTKTPYCPKLNHWYRDEWVDVTTSVLAWSNAKASAASPRSASSQASRAPGRAAGPVLLVDTPLMATLLVPASLVPALPGPMPAAPRLVIWTSSYPGAPPLAGAQAAGGRPACCPAPRQHRSAWRPCGRSAASVPPGCSKGGDCGGGRGGGRGGKGVAGATWGWYPR